VTLASIPLSLFQRFGARPAPTLRLPYAPLVLSLLLRRPHFARLWLASAVSLCGDWLSFVAVSRLAIDRGGGALALAGILAAHMLPGALASPLAGILADRFDRRRLLVAAAVLQGGLTLLMAMAAARGSLPLVQVLLLLRGIAAALVPPAEAAALRDVVHEDELLAANSLLTATWSVSYVGGMALGGALAALGPTTAIALDAATFAFSAALVGTVPPLPPPSRASRVPLGAVVRTVGADLSNALAHARARPLLARAVLGKVPIAVAAGAGWLALNLFADRARPFGAAALSLGVLQAVRGAGTGVGPVLAVGFVDRGGRTERAATVAYLVAFAGIAFFARTLDPAAILAVVLVWGTGSGANWVLSSAELQRRSDAGFVGRLAAIDELACSGLQVLSALAAALALRAGASIEATTIGAVVAGAAAWGALIASTRAPTGVEPATG
jgi:MFS family permease